jgi:putative nucleotidyltransferase with HDIG domain
MSIVDQIQKFVETESRSPSSKYGYGPYKYHFAVVVEYAQELAKELGADEEIVTLAAWLHDIGSIVYGRKDHHITSAKIAKNELKKLGYPADKIEHIKKCILNHRGSQKNNHQSLESQIIAEADALSNFNNISGIFMATYVYEGCQDQGKAAQIVMQKIENKWNQLHFAKSKKLARSKYEAIKLLLTG